MTGDDEPASAELTMSSRLFARLVTGRADADPADVQVSGDADLASQVLLAMNILF